MLWIIVKTSQLNSIELAECHLVLIAIVVFLR